MKVISFLNHKGGVCKTSTSIHLAHQLSKLDYSVLLFDLDHQLNLTEFFVDKLDDFNIEKVFRDYSLIDSAILPTRYKNISIVQGSDNIPLIEYDIQTSNQPWDCLKNIIHKSKRIKKEFDFVIMDTHPGIYPFVTCALIASDYYIIPVLSECNFSLKGLMKVENYIQYVKEKYDSQVQNLGYLINQFVYNNKMSKFYVKSLYENRPGLVFETKIRRTTLIPNALSQRKVQSEMKGSRTHHCGREDFKALAEEFLAKVGDGDVNG